MSTPTRERRAPWPTPTPTPEPVASSSKHKRRRDLRQIVDRNDDTGLSQFDARDVITDESQIQAAMQQCQVFSGNSVISCFPTQDTTIPQHQFASFVWNSRRPQLTQTNLVNIYLFSATSQQILVQWNNVTNPTGNAGVIHAQVNDQWFGSRGSTWNGANETYLYYWVITRADQEIDGSIVPQPIFTAIQTTYADSVIASMSSTSAAAESSRSVASASSASLASLSSAATASSTRGGLGGPHSSSTPGDGSGNVQNGGGGSSFPHWAIAVIVVLGFLALLAGGILTFLIMRRLRNRRNTSSLSHRSSMGSSTPMMQNAPGAEPHSPLMATTFGAGAIGQPHSADGHDGASTISRGSEAAPFSGADAAVMADAFRAALRKPNFIDQPVEEGESPDSDPNMSPGAGALLNQELAEEGRDIRSVGSSRGVRVETLSDTGTIQDHP